MNLTQQNIIRTRGIIEALRHLNAGSTDYTSDIAAKTITGELTVAGVSLIAEQVFSNCRQLMSVSFSDVTFIGSGAFRGCTGLISADFPALTTCYDSRTISDGCFAGCSQLTHLNMPQLTNVPVYFLSECKALKKVCFPSAASVDSYAFYDCTALEEADLPSATVISCMLFNGYGKDNVRPKRLILRSTEGVCRITSYYRYLVGVGDELRIFVPRDLLEAYENSSYWQSHTGQFLPLEDYTADGTLTGEIDLLKLPE